MSDEEMATSIRKTLNELESLFAKAAESGLSVRLVWDYIRCTPERPFTVVIERTIHL